MYKNYGVSILEGTPNTAQFTTSEKPRIIVFDRNGTRLLDIDENRIKVFERNVNPRTGEVFINTPKKITPVPDEIMRTLKRGE